MINHLKLLYKHPLTLLTDLYQLTMAYGYWKSDKLDQEAVFSLFFRQAPFNGSYAIATGLKTVLEYLEDLQFSEAELSYLTTLESEDGCPLFEQAFLDYLSELRFTCHVDAVPEGSLIFPHEPILRVQGPLLQCQLLETALLNIINFQTLIATKTTRIYRAAQGAPILEFGLRRAQGIDGAITASRAAYIGGCAATSNVLAGKLYDIPIKGTHAHSWVMSFATEHEAFTAYADAMPKNCVFLVDTYDTLEGVKTAIDVSLQLKEKGYIPQGIRLDSGDLLTLSQQARHLLDNAGLTEMKIVASNDLDEHAILKLKAAGACIDIWGIGTQLVTSYDQPALGGVYKLAAIRPNPQSDWQYRMKISAQSLKTSNPGLLQIRRFVDSQGFLMGDLLYNQLNLPINTKQSKSLNETTEPLNLPTDTRYTDLLVPCLRYGECVCATPSLIEIRQRVQEQLAFCPEHYTRFDSPQPYPVHIDEYIAQLKQTLMNSQSTVNKE